LTARRFQGIIARQEVPSMIRPLLLAAFVAGLAGACMTMTPAQQERNQALWTAARSCENGSLSVVRMSTEGVPYTQTMNSSGHEFPIFEACYRGKATPIWGAYCRAELAGPLYRR
jgi:hypothetical protein